MTNKNEICKCGHEKNLHFIKERSCMHENKKEKYDCPCKKFEPQTSELSKSPFDTTDLCMNGIPIGALNKAIAEERQRLRAEVEKILDEVLKKEIEHTEMINKQHKIKDINLSINLTNLVVEIKKRLFG